MNINIYTWNFIYLHYVHCFPGFTVVFILISWPAISSYILLKYSSGKSLLSDIQLPLFIFIYCSLVILVLTCGECKSVVNMMIEYERTYNVSALSKSPLLNKTIYFHKFDSFNLIVIKICQISIRINYFGLHSNHRLANFSNNLSIFWASPGNRNPSRKNRNAETTSLLTKFIWST